MMGLLGLAIAPVLALTQKEITDLVSLQEIATRILDEFDFLQKRKQKTERTINKLRRIVDYLEELEGSYVEATEPQVENTGAFVK
mmetsp:Transcript_30254/g.59924  ORF Transcript_30254/g.59924 Transcript_30254/m.59924 type:complete len:85 (-) Transcript_30254:434-688(-)|eukprot:CAMPEP_0194318336 /NCGR_PEP_ID=MMETSP0171-20130528/14957_1 /TAXON_ID=218684 /ORGANISM="Corethron pennatum, Strain L29A3" /LENGTH=84 /DNA_ID=CAMNT_0039075215 /DNA_START=1672 /DNA_END=1926 /DNA_ORIENTATION=+